MMSIRKLFGAAAVLLLVSCQPKADQLIILHTNDTHSQVEPLWVKSQGSHLGGYARREKLMEQERQKAEQTPLLLVDAGDFFQGTPYFNIYHGRVEIDAMNRAGYDAATLGNHEFDNGLDTLAAVLQTAKFPIVCANYDVAGTPLQGIIKPYTVVKKNGLRIGIFGLGVNPESLIADKNFAPVKYIDPIATAQKMEDVLKNKEHCDVVLCLSHLGYENPMTEASDEDIAAHTKYTNAIIGGHTHKLICTKLANAQGDSVVVAQMQKSGIYVGKITLTLQ